jgi:hypothetical protein
MEEVSSDTRSVIRDARISRKFAIFFFAMAAFVAAFWPVDRSHLRHAFGRPGIVDLADLAARSI